MPLHSLHPVVPPAPHSSTAEIVRNQSRRSHRPARPLTASIALVLIGVHAASTAVTLRGPYGAAAVGAVGLAAGATTAAILGFAASGRWGRTLIAGSIGLAALVNCIVVDGPDAAMNGIGRTQASGIASGLAGLALIGIAARVALRGRRRLVQALAIPIALLVAQFVLMPAFNVGVITNTPHPQIPPAAALGYPGARDVAFPASDGTQIAGWFVPGTTRAAVILTHGSHGTRESELPYLRLLASEGFSVLAIDARGHGESGGHTNALGWHGDRDIAGAVSFLRRQAGVDPARVAALGISMGAEEALRARANGAALAAVVADGAGASTPGDIRLEPRSADAPIRDAVNWLAYRGVALRTGEQPPPALKDIVHRITTPVLLIASNVPNEHQIDAYFQRQIGHAASLWYVADAGHTQALTVHPAEYRARVVAFLRRALGSPTATVAG